MRRGAAAPVLSAITHIPLGRSPASWPHGKGADEALAALLGTLEPDSPEAAALIDEAVSGGAFEAERIAKLLEADFHRLLAQRLRERV